jgi:hypothetical protein
VGKASKAGKMWLEPRVRRGNLSVPLGGNALVGGVNYAYCGDCSPEPLHYATAVRLRVREVGIVMDCGQTLTARLDVLECPVCHKQILR